MMLIWNRGWLLAANVVFGLVINLPCIIVARYNRLRLTNIMRHRA
jgi:hypothetical protein